MFPCLRDSCENHKSFEIRVMLFIVEELIKICTNIVRKRYDSCTLITFKMSKLHRFGICCHGFSTKPLLV